MEKKKHKHFEVFWKSEQSERGVFAEIAEIVETSHIAKMICVFMSLWMLLDENVKVEIERKEARLCLMMCNKLCSQKNNQGLYFPILNQKQLVTTITCWINFKTMYFETNNYTPVSSIFKYDVVVKFESGSLLGKFFSSKLKM